MKRGVAEFDDDLTCFVKDVRSESKKRRGTLVVPEMNCPEMSAAIRLFEEIDPDVREILVLNSVGGELKRDTVYRRKGGEWKALSFV